MNVAIIPKYQAMKNPIRQHKHWLEYSEALALAKQIISSKVFNELLHSGRMRISFGWVGF